MQDVEIKFFKMLSIYSLIFGALCALLSLIPSFMPFFALFFTPFLGGVVPLILLLKRDKFKANNEKTYALMGAFSGLCLCIAYIFVIIPFVLLFHLINKNYYDYGVQYLNLFLFILFFVMIAVVYMSANAVIGLIIGFLDKYLRERKQNE